MKVVYVRECEEKMPSAPPATGYSVSSRKQ